MLEENNRTRSVTMGVMTISASGNRSWKDRSKYGPGLIILDPHKLATLEEEESTSTVKDKLLCMTGSVLVKAFDTDAAGSAPAYEAYGIRGKHIPDKNMFVLEEKGPHVLCAFRETSPEDTVSLRRAFLEYDGWSNIRTSHGGGVAVAWIITSFDIRGCSVKIGVVV